jgi:hypothetical protein
VNALDELINSIGRLHLVSLNTIEECSRLTLDGCFDNRNSFDELIKFKELYKVIELAPVFMLDGVVFSFDDLNVGEFECLEGRLWRLIIGKGKILRSLLNRGNAKNWIFFSEHALCKWVQGIDPFGVADPDEIDFGVETTIWVVGLKDGFGGPRCWVLPYGESITTREYSHFLPTREDVQSVVHVASEKAIRINPDGLGLTWGNLDSEVGHAFVRQSALVLSATLVQELVYRNGLYETVLRGHKKLSLRMINEVDDIDSENYDTILNCVSWVYSERAETRQKLVMDRLSIDIQPNETYLSGLKKYLHFAHQQARDSYSFVISERRDAYYKEMRELMKDMKSQADLYAVKVRDLVISICRDILGIIVLIGFSFISKFDQEHLKNLIDSREFMILTRVLAGYFVFSCLIQFVTNWRDSWLSFAESNKWLEILQSYTSSHEARDRFMEPLKRRRATLWVALAFAVLIYGGLAAVLWHFPYIAKSMMNY